MYIYDSVKKSKVKFVPISNKKVSIYVCGPTVYDDAHLGHARSSLSFDLLARTLRKLNYKVVMVKNFTDIDDKIIAKVKETGKSLQEITTHYIERYLADMGALGVQRADIEPKATEYLEGMEEIIQTLLKRGIAYKVDNGDIYFDTSKDKKYGKISNRVVENEESINRVSHNEEKRNLKDFALWKSCKDNKDICFETSLGRGRPGWHIECSAMIAKNFEGNGKYCIDIHGGGVDLLFPHHENEASQTRCSLNHELAKYWMHNGFVKVEGEKMSKSLGNSFFIKDALKIYDGEILRNYLISGHYRNDFNFSIDDLLKSKKRLDKLYRLKKRVISVKPSRPNGEFERKLLDAMSDDLNISEALATIDGMINHANDRLDDNTKDRGLKREILANIYYVNDLLGIGGKEPFGYFQLGMDKNLKAKIEHFIEMRNDAKRSKNYLKADKIRDKITEMGIRIMDTSAGTVWEKI